jgi:hypothetical protein
MGTKHQMQRVPRVATTSNTGVGFASYPAARFLRTHSRAFFAPFFNRSAEESAEDMYSDEFDEELSYLAKQVSISGAGSPAQAMPYCY